MAGAASYNDWEDVGVAFSEEELRDYRPASWAEARVSRLVSVGQVVLRREEMELPMPVFWKQVRQSVLRRMVTWYCRALVIECPPISPSELRVDPTSSSGKAVTKAALDLEAANFIGLLRGEAEAGMRHCVTIGRRCSTQKDASGWKKEDASLSNKLANAIQSELSQWSKLQAILDSIPAASDG